MIKLTGERARIDAKANQSYVVYKDSNGKLNKEHYTGSNEYLEFEKLIMFEANATLFVFAGNNGSGKSTIRSA
jgi:predicted ATPase